MGRSTSLEASYRTARVAVVTLFLNGLFGLVTLGFWLLVGGLLAQGPLSAQDATTLGDVVVGFQTVSWLLLVVGGARFLIWVLNAHRCAQDLGAGPLRYSAWSTIVSFFVPIWGLVRPYQALRELSAAVDPGLVPERAPRPATTEHVQGYREPAAVPRPAARELRRPPLLAWWLVWVTITLFGLASVVWTTGSWAALVAAGVVSRLAWVVDAVLAILVVHRIDARLRERAMRLR
jgi:Domain of unknown function (DUF4328)